MTDTLLDKQIKQMNYKLNLLRNLIDYARTSKDEDKEVAFLEQYRDLLKERQDLIKRYKESIDADSGQ